MKTSWIQCLGVVLASLGLCAMVQAASPTVEFVGHPDGKPKNWGTLAGKIKVVNFWATWCKPCRKEMPEMSHWYQNVAKKQKIAMVGIALDETANIGAFLKTTPVAYPIWRYAGTDSRGTMKKYGNKIGVLPYTVVFAQGCDARETLVGEVNAQRLDKAVLNIQNACVSKK